MGKNSKTDKFQPATDFIRAHFDDLVEGRVNKVQLARMILREFPGLYANLTTARLAVNWVTGARGPRSKAKAIANGTYFESSISKGLAAIKSHATGVTPVRLDDPSSWLILSDIHLPYHDPVALEAAIDHGISEGCDHLLLNGDIMDCYYLSRFDKRPGAPDLSTEIDCVRRFLDVVSSGFKAVVWKFGNHEDRFDRYIVSKAPELWGQPGLDLKGLVKPEDHGCSLVVDAYSPIHLGHLCVIHGHEFGSGTTNPVNPARGLFLRAKASTIAGHNHQTSEHHESSIKGDAMACWSTGCLCELSPGYRPFAFTKWNHGFAMASIEGDRSFTVRNKRIIDGVVH